MHKRFLVMAALMCFVGCGDKAVPVSGVVKMDGKPLAGANVHFQPVKEGNNQPGPPSEGKTDAEGKFTLQIVSDQRPGAMVGKHTVTITKLEGDAIPDSAKPTIPKVVVRAEQSFEVPSGGTDKAHFDVKPGDSKPGVVAPPPMPK